MEGIQILHDDTIVVTLIIANYDIHRISIDNGSFTDILFYNTVKMNLSGDHL